MSDIPKIKICGLSRECDIDYINMYSPEYMGFIFYPKSHRYVDSYKAEYLRQHLDIGITPVGVFVDESVFEIIKLVRSGIIDMVQLHGNESEDDIKTIHDATGARIIKAIKVKEGDEISKWNDSEADFLLLDSGMGSGKTFDWNAKIELPSKPFFLAGGINSDNVKQAIDIFSPYCIDLSSSVETDKLKDPVKIKEIIKAIRG